MQSAIVIGGGLVGTSVAWRLAEAGVNVTILEAGSLGSGASHASFAWLSASSLSTRSYYHLKVDAIHEYQNIVREIGTPRWLHLDGHIEWNAGGHGGEQTRGYDGLIETRTEGTGAEHLRQKVSELRELGYTAELLPVRELRALEPDMVAPPGLDEFVYYPQEGYINPVDAIGDFSRRARDHGAKIVPNSRVVEVIREGDHVRGVTTADGERFLADMVISCAGSWSADLLGLAGVHLDMAPAVGMVAISSPSAVQLRAVHHNEALSLRPDGAGRIMMRNYDFDQMVTPDMPVTPLPSFLNDLFQRAVAVLPGLASTHIEAMRIAVRPIPADGFPLVGAVPGVSGLYLMVCHAAAILGPFLGRLAAREIAFDEKDSRLNEFRPERLLASPAVSDR